MEKETVPHEDSVLSENSSNDNPPRQKIFDPVHTGFDGLEQELDAEGVKE